MMHSAKLVACTLAVALAFVGLGCATVEPWEREHLASRTMAQPLAQDMSTAEYRDKVVRTKTGASVMGAAPGAGCGCAQ